VGAWASSSPAPYKYLDVLGRPGTSEYLWVYPVMCETSKYLHGAGE